MRRLLKPDEPFVMFKMDLDQFKSVNEALGHGGGDAAIRFYCLIVKEILGLVGEVYRRGGDEVVVIAPGLTEERAKDLAERVRAQIESRFRVWASERGLTSGPTASIGVVLARGTTPTSEVTRLADEAQKQAKQQGKNRVFVLSIN
jgi:diguanylate cyclase (GGDEF)-like protein